MTIFQKKLKNDTREIEVINNRIVYTLKEHNLKWYFTYNEVLLYFLTLNIFSPYLHKKDRLRFKICSAENRKDISAEDLAIGCYSDWINKYNLFAGLERVKQHRVDNDLEIDHLDGYPQNITVYNINFMDRKLNAHKGMITRYKCQYKNVEKLRIRM